ncbi:MAG TPA: TlpA disulfide reductase family protein [Flavisolibacter sp.]|nr:TlpA disulfide reductase family protein [Flavisolibacter sp.]
MKKSFLLMLLAASLIVKAQQNLVIEPQKPVAGTSVTIKFNPKNTALSGVKDIEAVAYLFESDMPVAKVVQLKKQGDLLVGTVKTEEKTKAVFFSFRTEEIEENNGDEGYYTAIYDKNGQPVQGANLALSQGFGSYGSIWGLKRSNEKVLAFQKEEFSVAGSKEKFFADYLRFLGQSKDEESRNTLKAVLQQQLAKTTATEAELNAVRMSYASVLKDKEQEEAVKTAIRERFPNGDWKKEEGAAAFFKEKTLAGKAAIFDRLVAAYGPVKKDDNMMENMASQLAQRFADSADYEKSDRYIAHIASVGRKANIYNGIAWKLAGQGLANKPVDAAKGIEYARRALDLLEQEKKQMASQPSYYTAKQYIKNLDNSYHSYSDTYAVLLYHQGQQDKAYELEKKAVEHFKGKNINMNESFALLTEKTKGGKAAQAELEKFMEEGKYTPRMKEQLKALYMADNHDEAQWVKYAGGLEQVAFNKLKAELAKKMINMPAPDFRLKDLEGNEVALSSLKGKVVVVDFWATWCGPCLASFPGMQKAVEKYKGNPDVVFLFIDTWETGDDREKKVKDLVMNKKYPFLVLYDETKKDAPEEFSIVSDYKVEGIPTKFVIDKNNNIRFKSVGFGGSADGLVTELSAMIEMAGSGDAGTQGNGAKKAF